MTFVARQTNKEKIEKSILPKYINQLGNWNTNQKMSTYVPENPLIPSQNSLIAPFLLSSHRQIILIAQIKIYVTIQHLCDNIKGGHLFNDNTTLALCGYVFLYNFR